MKKKYITLEEVLALRGTDTKIYGECDDTVYLKFNGDILCRYNKESDRIECFGACLLHTHKIYILEPEEFKVEKTGKYKTRDGRVAYVSYIDADHVRGIIEGNDISSGWLITGGFSDGCQDNSELVEYVGD